MTKKSYFFMFVIVVSLAAAIGISAQRKFAEYTAEKNKNVLTDDRHFQSNYEEDLLIPGSTIQAEIPAGQNDFPESRTLETSVTKKILETEKMISELEKKDAQKAAEVRKKTTSAVSKYVEAPVVQQFNKDLKDAGFGNIDFSKMNGPDFATLSQNPKVMSVLLKYMQNPEFVKLMQQMYKDPNVKAATDEARNLQNN